MLPWYLELIVVVVAFVVGALVYRNNAKIVEAKYLDYKAQAEAKYAALKVQMDREVADLKSKLKVGP